MKVTPEERQHLEEALARLEELDPAEVPDQATRLADLLEHLLDSPGEAV